MNVGIEPEFYISIRYSDVILLFVAICNPPCENDGKCTEPNTCKCPENFEGNRCEKGTEKKCANKPEIQQAEANCKSNSSCTISCEKGHIFPDGSTDMEMICKNGEWMPASLEQAFALSCQCKFCSFLHI